MTQRKTHTTPPAIADDRLLTVDDILARVPVARTTLWRMVREGQFPRPLQLTASRIGWRLSAVLAWLQDREEHPVLARAYYRRGSKPRRPDAIGPD